MLSMTAMSVAMSTFAGGFAGSIGCVPGMPNWLNPNVPRLASRLACSPPAASSPDGTVVSTFVKSPTQWPAVSTAGSPSGDQALKPTEQTP